MGTWGTTAYENDSAADWFGDLWDEFAVPQKVEQTLRLSLDDHHEQVRAASNLLIQLGRVYQWPVEDIDRHCHLAAYRLQQMQKMELYDGESVQAQLTEEIAILQSRISQNYRAPADPLQAHASPPLPDFPPTSYHTQRRPFYFISAKPLIEEFRAGAFHDALAAPYFILYMVLNSITFLFITNATSWDVASNTASVLITLFGLFYLKHKNGKTFGDQFFAKYFTLGWIAVIRLLLFVGPTLVALGLLYPYEMDDQTERLAWLCIGIAFETFYFWHLGGLFAKARPSAHPGADTPA